MRPLIPLLFLLLPSVAMADRYGFSVAASDSLSTTVSCEAIKAVSGTDAQSKDVPNQARLGVLVGSLSSVVTAVSVDWYLALDSAGEVSITDQVTETILDEDADATGSIVSVLDIPLSITDAHTAQGSLYVCAKTNAGTASLVSRLFWQVES